MIPFSRPILRYFLLWMSAGGILFYGMVKLALGNKTLDETSGGLIIQFLAFLPLFWFLGSQFLNKLEIRFFFQPQLTGIGWKKCLIIWLAILSFSYAIEGLQIILVNRILPHVAPGMVEGPIYLSDQSFAINFLNLLLAIVIGPVMEELVFRGLILQRFMVKTSTPKAIIFSSILFGILHFESWSTATVFGVVMCLLFLRSQNLWIPILFHVANNASVVGVNILQYQYDNTWSIDQIISLYPLYVVGLISIPFLFHFIKKNWPKENYVLPYAANLKNAS